MKNRIVHYYWPALLWAMILFGLSIGSGIQIPDVGISSDKVGHLVAYGILSWLFFSGLKKEGLYTLKNAHRIILITSFYGAMIEVVQWAFFPHRYFEVWDMVANITGTCLSHIIFRLFIIKT